jgi:hypothetical protein
LGEEGLLYGRTVFPGRKRGERHPELTSKDAGQE